MKFLIDAQLPRRLKHFTLKALANFSPGLEAQRTTLGNAMLKRINAESVRVRE